MQEHTDEEGFGEGEGAFVKREAYLVDGLLVALALSLVVFPGQNTRHAPFLLLKHKAKPNRITLPIRAPLEVQDQTQQDQTPNKCPPCSTKLTCLDQAPNEGSEDYIVTGKSNIYDASILTINSEYELSVEQAHAWPS